MLLLQHCLLEDVTLQINKLKKRSHTLEATVHVGKEGVTPALVEHLKKQLVVKKLIKVRLLSSLREQKRAIAEKLAQECNATLVRSVGFVVVLAKR